MEKIVKQIQLLTLIIILISTIIMYNLIFSDKKKEKRDKVKKKAEI